MSLDKLGDWRKTHYTTDLSPEMDGQTVKIGGWVQRQRDLGGLRFIILQDKFGFIQITMKKGVVSDELIEKSKVPNQSVLAITGKVKKFAKAPQGVEIIPEEIKVLNRAVEQLPVDMTGKTISELDTRLNNRPLDLRLPRNQAIFRIQNQMLIAIREVLNSKRFTEIITPKIIATATEGGTELFPIMYFDKNAYLSQSAQLYKEQLTVPFENVFELGACYRAEKSFTNRHLCEIYVLDIEMAYATMYDVFDVMEDVLEHTTKKIYKECEEDLKILGVYDKFEIAKKPFDRLTYKEILDKLESEFNIKLEFGEDIPTEAYRKLGTILPGYYWITHWPMSIKPFYIQPDENDPTLSQGFDLQKGWLELSSGGTRVHDKQLLIKQLEERGLNPKSFEYHLKAFDFGMPPHAGLGFGIARYLAILTGIDQVKETVLYPRTPDRLTP
ncbi:MAG: aspartate--tRNA(Asn) ligase [Promethearchaeota archaeon]